jgi:hypothetical protein
MSDYKTTKETDRGAAMCVSTKETIEEDIRLQDSSSLQWDIQNDGPEIKQIFGHFLPPAHRMLVKGLVAKDFNFPPAYHKCSNAFNIEQLYELGENIDGDIIVSLNDLVRIRDEREGAIVYTPYFNGFYLNAIACDILKCCEKHIRVAAIASKLDMDVEVVSKFISRAITLELVNASTS